MEDYKKLYEQTQNKMKEFIKRWDGIKLSSNDLFTKELKQIVEIESEDERIRKEIIEMVRNWASVHYITKEQFSERMTWLEKQGNITKLSEEEKNKFAKGVLTSCALSFINYLDAHKYEGKMCVSNGECEDIENAFHNAMWDRLHRYYCKYIEKQGEPNPYIGVSFKYNGRTWDMCARDGGVAILVDGEIKERIFLDNKPQDKSALEAIKEGKVDNANKVEPEFKVGDWITFYGGNPYKILKIEEEINGVLEYLLLDQNGHDFYFSKAHVDKNVRLWTIQDAKDGDVLIDKSHIGECVFIFKEARASDIKTDVNNPLAIIGYCGINHIGFTSQLSGLGFGDTVNCTYYPATKEQRDTLERVMTNAGYRWNKEELKLEKI